MKFSTPLRSIRQGGPVGDENAPAAAAAGSDRCCQSSPPGAGAARKPNASGPQRMPLSAIKVDSNVGSERSPAVLACKNASPAATKGIGSGAKRILLLRGGAASPMNQAPQLVPESPNTIKSASIFTASPQVMSGMQQSLRGTPVKRGGADTTTATMRSTRSPLSTPRTASKPPRALASATPPSSNRKEPRSQERRLLQPTSKSILSISEKFLKSSPSIRSPLKSPPGRILQQQQQQPTGTAERVVEGRVQSFDRDRPRFVDQASDPYDAVFAMCSAETNSLCAGSAAASLPLPAASAPSERAQSSAFSSMCGASSVSTAANHSIATPSSSKMALAAAGAKKIPVRVLHVACGREEMTAPADDGSKRQIFNPIPDRKFSSHGNAIFPMFSADGDAAAGRCISAIAPTPNCTGTGTGTGAAALFFLDDVGSLGPSVSVVATSPHNDNGIPDDCSVTSDLTNFTTDFPAPKGSSFQAVNRCLSSSSSQFPDCSRLSIQVPRSEVLRGASFVSMDALSPICTASPTTCVTTRPDSAGPPVLSARSASFVSIWGRLMGAEKAPAFSPSEGLDLRAAQSRTPNSPSGASDVLNAAMQLGDQSAMQLKQAIRAAAHSYTADATEQDSGVDSNASSDASSDSCLSGAVGPGHPAAAAEAQDFDLLGSQDRVRDRDRPRILPNPVAKVFWNSDPTPSVLPI